MHHLPKAPTPIARHDARMLPVALLALLGAACAPQYFGPIPFPEGDAGAAEDGGDAITRPIGVVDAGLGDGAPALDVQAPSDVAVRSDAATAPDAAATSDVTPSPDASSPPDAAPPPPDASPPPDVAPTPDVAGTPDVVVHDAAAPDAAAGCSLVGAFWFRSPIGGTLYLRMRTDGTWSYGASLASPDGSPLSGTWSTSGNQVSVRETGTSLTGCTSSQLGVYRTSFDAACNVAVLTLVSDPCSLRATFMGGRSFNRITP